MESISVRDARKEDASDIARLMVMAWPVQDFLDLHPGQTLEDFTAFIAGFVAAEGNLYSYEFTKVAVLTAADGEEKIVGAMNGYDGARYMELKRPVLEALSADAGSGGGFAEAVETEAGEFYLDSAGVDPQMRSRGIGSMLFKAMLERAASEGFKVAGLIVDEDKPAAEALYLRLGFTVTGYRDFFGHRMKHMQKNL